MDYYKIDYSYSNDLDFVEQHKYFEQSKRVDKGHNEIYRKMEGKNGVMKMKKIDIYTSGDAYTHIRDAETGSYYSNLVGSADEDLFFKVILSTGECKSKNGSSTQFYLSPRHYMAHNNCELDEQIISNWQEKRDYRVKEKSVNKKINLSTIIN
jgi:hypothetical protein